MITSAAVRPLARGIASKAATRPFSHLSTAKVGAAAVWASTSLNRDVQLSRYPAFKGPRPTLPLLVLARGLTTTTTKQASATVTIPEDAGAPVPLPSGGEGQLPDVEHSRFQFPRMVGGKQVGHILPVTEVAQGHPFHLVDLSPWPKAMSNCALVTMGGLVLALSNTVGGGTFLLMAVLNTTWCLQRWLNDVVHEGAHMGNHTMRVVNNLVTGFSLFILSEVMLFFSIFWAFLHSSLSPSVELGSMWPPLGIEPLEAGLIPTLNTVLLVSSGASVTWAHHALLAGNRQSALNGMALTLAFSAVFTGLQAYEYHISPFTYADSVFGNTFYFSTGAHGLHVILGTTMLAVGMARIINYQLTQHHHLGLEAAILYWHMVDVVWLALYGMVYWWGS